MNSLLARYVSERNPFMIIYQSGRGQFTQRMVYPISCDKETLTAFCCLRRQIRTFKVSNILSVAKNTA
ncbi:hypothetical protein QUF84_10995 [Fictibacillus enclensis]|uniref:WYL domain-containing protein n=1 Tax=Fictibacillus TaxID=1329200 RepID=UPI000815F8B9|nr:MULTISPECIES: hypothetical protein [Fictibacillus]MDM5337745.1 hypothetical protein [Fictibacillus enclensis]RXY99563.1 hypothetical protein DMO16_07645 [Fictibacillus sp. S7]WHY74110.1 hypothetical protein QNH15_09475 [Fictibacillus enclensis]SCB85669.1 hypothetical protein GA0061096_0937 [Fictibacillus enclensis]